MVELSPVAYLFAYGSLAADAIDPSRPPALVQAAGLRRSWNVAMDNSVTLPGYKYYVDPADGSRPQVFVTFLNLVRDAGCSVNGVLLPVDELRLEVLDARERNYVRGDISAQLTRPAQGPVWAYFGSEPAIARFQQGLGSGTAVVQRAYYEQVRSQFERLGAGAYADYLASTDEPRCPLAELQRVEL